MDATFGVPFDNADYDQFMFATGDGQLWLITVRDRGGRAHKHATHVHSANEQQARFLSKKDCRAWHAHHYHMWHRLTHAYTCSTNDTRTQSIMCSDCFNPSHKAHHWLSSIVIV